MIEELPSLASGLKKYEIIKVDRSYNINFIFRLIFYKFVL